MIEITGDIFNVKDADAICVTTNGVIKANGELVMGAGIAKAFATRWPKLPTALGKKVAEGGNQVYIFHLSFNDISVRLGNPSMPIIFSFPTKYHWKDDSDINLIKTSAQQLAKLVTKLEMKKVVLTRPGCGLAHVILHWQTVNWLLESVGVQ